MKKNSRTVSVTKVTWDARLWLADVVAYFPSGGLWSAAAEPERSARYAREDYALSWHWERGDVRGTSTAPEDHGKKRFHVASEWNNNVLRRLGSWTIITVFFVFLFSFSQSFVHFFLFELIHWQCFYYYFLKWLLLKYVFIYNHIFFISILKQ